MPVPKNFKAIIGSPKFQMMYDVIRSSGLFDGHYYLASPGFDSDYREALIHYILRGAFYKDPSPYFSTPYYLSKYPDIFEAKLNPLYHYIQHGEEEGRSPNPFFEPAAYAKLNPDLASGWEATLLLHFIRQGKLERRAYAEYFLDHQQAIETDDYSRWIVANESGCHDEVVRGLKKVDQPLISVLVPVYNTDPELLRACIESVTHQSYQNWQLCLADDKSTNQETRAVLKEYGNHKQISVVMRRVNGNISECSNSALKLAKGDWVALLDHDDLLHEHALYYVAKELTRHPKSKLIYTDEDKIDEKGHRYDPHFKSDWNAELLLGQNYISHLTVMKRTLVRKVGGFRKGYEGSQDHDLLLRYVREISDDTIRHIPRPLYHWRAIEGSTALAAEEKKFTSKSGLKALRDHIRATKVQASVKPGLAPNTYKVERRLRKKPKVSLIIPTRNGLEITRQAIESILGRTEYPNYEIVLIDNDSDDPLALQYFEEINRQENIKVIRYAKPFNFSAINNFAVRKCDGDVIGFVNNDIEVISASWLDEMVRHVVRDEVGCVGAKLYYPDDTIQHAGIILGIGGVAGHSHKYLMREDYGYFSRLCLTQYVSAVTAACMLVRREVFEAVGGFNEKHLKVAFNDVDLCLKVEEAGFRHVWTPYAELYHHESVSRGSEDSPKKVKRFNREIDYMLKNWGERLVADQYYNPNLSTEREDFSLNLNR